jgi:hypothetical protein
MRNRNNFQKIAAFFLLCAGIPAMAQKSFEGDIIFKTTITSTKYDDAGFQKETEARFGDSLIMHYNTNGFVRKHLNSGPNGKKFQTYKGDGILLIDNGVEKTDPLDVSKNSLVFLLKKKIENQNILGLDCECYRYNGIAEGWRNVRLTYCYSTKTPFVDEKPYVRHEDFFLYDFFKTANRPYLRFIMEIDDFTLDYTAVKIIAPK